MAACKLQQEEAGMNICVCVKQVPDTNSIKIDPETHTLIRKGVPSIVNPFDLLAVEMAVRLKERYGGRVIVVSMGPMQALSAIRSCLAVGADAGYLVTDRLFGGSDTFATSYILSQAIREIARREQLDFDLILCGKQAIDGDTAQVGPELAGHLSIAQVTYAVDVELTDPSVKEGSSEEKPEEKCDHREGSYSPERHEIIVKRETDHGYELVAVPAPALVTVSGIPGEPRYPTIGSKRASKQMEIMVLDAESLPGLERGLCGLKGSPTRVKKTYTPVSEKVCKRIDAGSPAEKVEMLAGMLQDEKMI